MSKFKITIFDVDVGGNVHEETFSRRHEALASVRSVIDGYDYEKEFADEREAREHLGWNAKTIIHEMNELMCSPFFGECCVWLPGHHRKITIEEIEENSR